MWRRFAESFPQRHPQSQFVPWGSQFQTWLFRIATNKARDFREKKHAAKRGGGQIPLSLRAEDAETGLTIDPPSPAPSPDVDLLNVERAELVRQALDQVGEPCREIIELRYFGDLSYDDLSRELQLNPKTVSSRLSKCCRINWRGLPNASFPGERKKASRLTCSGT